MHLKIKPAFTLLLLALILLNYSAPGFAEVEYTFEGYGYGHGIGMCQWGSKGRADQGQTYEQILGHYYQGTQVAKNFNVPKEIRVRLFGSANLPKVYIEGDGSTAFDFIKTDGTYAIKGATGKWCVVPTVTGSLRLVKPDGTVAADNLPGPIIAAGSATNLVVYNASGARYHAYKGSIYIYPTSSNALYLVNYVNFEPDYLNGLGEVPSSWPYHALYTQAVAARTYAIANMKPQNGYDLDDSTASQVYKGVDKVNETVNGTNWGARWAKAVADTKGQVVTYNDAIVSTFYFSSCGGHTENVELAWSNAKPQDYLKGVSDLDPRGKPYCEQAGNSNFRWTSKITKSELEAKLGISGIAGLEVTKRGVSARVSELKIKKADGTSVFMTGAVFRSKLGLRSTWINRMGGIFPDVPLDYWALSQIESLAERNIIAGFPDGTFRPGTPVTRAQFAKVLCLALGIESGGSSDFIDAKEHWAEPYIAPLVSHGVITGYANGTFKPDAQITRAEICTVIARAKSLAPRPIQIMFSDIADHWARSYVELAASNSIVTGYDGGLFKPNLNSTRAEVSAIVYRTIGSIQ